MSTYLAALASKQFFTALTSRPPDSAWERTPADGGASVSDPDHADTFPERVASCVESFIASCGDQQLFFTMAYVVAFYVSFGEEVPSVPQGDTPCRGRSQYHRSIISNTLLLGLSTHLVSGTFFWRLMRYSLVFVSGAGGQSKPDWRDSMRSAGLIGSSAGPLQL